MEYYMNDWEVDETEHNTSVEETNRSRISDVAVSSDFSWQPHDSHDIRFGASYQFHLYSPSRQSLMTVDAVSDRNNSARRYLGNEFSLYAEDEMTFLDRISLNIGLRYALSGASGKLWNSLDASGDVCSCRP